MIYFFDTCKNMIRTLPQLKYDETYPEDVDTKQEDHLYDELKYFLMNDPIPPRENIIRPEPEFSPFETDDVYPRFVF